MTLPPGRASLTLAAWAQQWFANRQELRESTRVRNLSLFKNHIQPALGDFSLADLTAPQVQAFISELTRKPVSKAARDGSPRTLAPATVREVYQELDKCLEAAKRAGHLRYNPCQAITLPRTKRQDMNLLDIGEVQALAEAIDDRYAALIYLLAYSGLRIGEAAALLPSDLESQGITVTKTAAEVRGSLVTSHYESTASRRSVPLPGFVATRLVQHVETYPGAHLFTGREGGQVRSNVFRARQFAKARQAIGRPDLRIHDLRHTAVSLWIAQGVDLQRIGVWAGHTTVTFTLERYGHLFKN